MENLNPPQREAVNHIQGPLLVLAGAGSGKTRVVTYRIARLIETGIAPSDILALTFTNKAAEEMRSRIRSLKNASIQACTFHSLGARILRESISALGYRPDFAIYDEDDSEKLLKSCLEIAQVPDKKGSLKKIRQEISSAKNEFQDPPPESLLGQVYSLYQSKLKECNALDFDDLLYLSVRLFQSHPEILLEYQNRWLFILIDEYQDTNTAQYLLAKMLSEIHGNLFAVGDPDQSIYSWRGARYQNILNFERDFPGAKVVTLDQNYRSTNTILEASNHLITRNQTRYEKNLWSALGPGEKIGIYVAPTDRLEAQFVVQKIAQQAAQHHLSYGEIALFYRTNAQSRSFEDALLSQKIPYKIIGGVSFYQRKEVKDILAFLRMMVSNSDLISFLRTVQTPKRGLGRATLDKIVHLASENRQPVLTYCEELLDAGEFKLNTRQKKGLESYLSSIRRLREKRAECNLFELISEIIQEFKYLDFLQEDEQTAEERKENLQELMGKAAEWETERENPSLSQFLEEVSLRSSTNDLEENEMIKLMTLHNSKGLEFTLVFMVGMEEEILPHASSFGKDEALEEERRLCYVGMTRAKKNLYLTAAMSRYNWGGDIRRMKPSRFFREIPSQYLANHTPSSVLKTSFSLPEQEHKEGGFQVGDRVVHPEFGEGVVKKHYQTSFGITYDIYFEKSFQTHTLIAKYAKLQPVC